jgi:hypothetical protein
VVASIAFFVLSLLGILYTLSFYVRGIVPEWCDFTKCDASWAATLLTWTSIVTGAVTLVGAVVTLVAARRGRPLVPALLTLIVLGVVCVCSLLIYTGAGPVNP